MCIIFNRNRRPTSATTGITAAHIRPQCFCQFVIEGAVNVLHFMMLFVRQESNVFPLTRWYPIVLVWLAKHSTLPIHIIVCSLCLSSPSTLDTIIMLPYMFSSLCSCSLPPFLDVYILDSLQMNKQIIILCLKNYEAEVLWPLVLIINVWNTIREKK